MAVNGPKVAEFRPIVSYSNDCAFMALNEYAPKTNKVAANRVADSSTILLWFASELNINLKFNIIL